MTILILIFGVLTFLVGVGIVMSPDLIFNSLKRQLGKVELHVLNVVVRVFFGVLMISLASASKFPFVVETIGWVCIVIAIILTLMGRENFNRIISWAIALLELYTRSAGFLIITFGTFLIYAFV